MGVLGLWRLLDPAGKPTAVETLEGKVLAIGNLKKKKCVYYFRLHRILLNLNVRSAGYDYIITIL